MKTMNKVINATSKRVKRMLRRTNQAYYFFAKGKVECNVCNYRANKLDSDIWHAQVRCPKCNSSIRHRLLLATFENTKEFNFKKILNGKEVLHFAPEKILSKLIKDYSKTYKTADFFTEGHSYPNIDYKIDISNMPEIASDSLDCVIACDVLEHVEDHIKGMTEVYRVLRKGGYCIFTVPQEDHLVETLEDPTVKTAQERENVYGDSEHLRLYGDDFPQFLKRCGFKVTAVDEHDFSKELADRYVLYPPVLSNKPHVTNYRKVFMGRK